ncbi:MAG: thioredoxin domain-containing protein [Candidatus Hydrogenedentota bacterium]|nr:MAG: thioredoxin domain-containing protein [Candidatus Hydrogenedentota bacterium]
MQRIFIRSFLVVLLSLCCKEQNKKMNHLKNEKSPYLLQHADNPVDWYPWSKEAFEKAKKENKPIFLSIGYSTCHWCHVMEHESFEDNEVAALLNQYFVSIKVDREERPDIDSIYMKVCIAMNGSGGWPLTIIMTPDKKPFFAGTYLPKNTMPGRLGLMDLLPKVAKMWKEDRDKLLSMSEELMSIFKTPTSKIRTTDFTEEALTRLLSRYDEKNGGFGHAPKFPSPHNFLFLAEIAEKKSGQKQKIILTITNSLDKIRSGGIFDHVGYGFHRYATDARWQIPHFEKMLYDQAMLMLAYTEAYRLTKEERFKNVLSEINSYIEERMLSSEGGFYSAEDADSEGIEGKFYTFRYDEITDLFSDQEVKTLQTWFSISKQGNFTDETGKSKNVLALKMPYADFYREAIVPHQWNKFRKILKQYRDKRVRPLRDDKILTDWNGLMIAAYAYVYRYAKLSSGLEKAKKAESFLWKTMYHTRKLLHRYRGQEAGISAHLSDYANLIFAELHLYDATFDVAYLEKAIQLQKDLDTFFLDEAGGYFESSSENKDLPVRTKEAYDGAIPSGNSIAMWNLAKLFHITGNVEYRQKAEKLYNAFAAEIKHAPDGYVMLHLAKLRLNKASPDIVLVLGENGNPFEEVIHSSPPDVQWLFIQESNKAQMAKISPYTKSMKAISGKTTAYLCKGFVCERPTTEVEVIKEKL